MSFHFANLFSIFFLRQFLSSKNPYPFERVTKVILLCKLEHLISKKVIHK